MNLKQTKIILTYSYDSRDEYHKHCEEMKQKGCILIRYDLDDYEADYEKVCVVNADGM